MTTKHTPGPWRVGITGHAVYQVAAPELRIALCSDLEELGGRETEKANARMIAAAPATLEALEATAAALELYADPGCCDGDQQHEDTCKVGRALQRAEAAMAMSRGQ